MLVQVPSNYVDVSESVEIYAEDPVSPNCAKSACVGSSGVRSRFPHKTPNKRMHTCRSGGLVSLWGMSNPAKGFTTSEKLSVVCFRDWDGSISSLDRSVRKP
jgi:hypothetical protein